MDDYLTSDRDSRFTFQVAADVVTVTQWKVSDGQLKALTAIHNDLADAVSDNWLGDLF